MTDLLSGVSAQTIDTARLKAHVYLAGPEDGEPIVFVHGNVSTGRFFEELLAALPDGFRGIAVDLRGFGRSEPKPIDATRGVRDFSDDVLSVMDALSVEGAHLVGWSVGGGVVMQMAIDAAARVQSLTLLAPMAPYGFAGTRDVDGTPCFADHAGSGGGTANPDFVRLLGEKDTSDAHQNSPRNVMNNFYVKPPFRVAPEREEIFVAELLTTVTGANHYPGDVATSPNWPTVAPGEHGMNNAISSKYTNLSGFSGISPKPPVLWIRGADDQIVSDTSFFDIGHLGALGFIPGWPGADVYPAQPMIGQIRTLLERYTANGGAFREAILEDCGHSPHIEKAEEVREMMIGFMQG